MTFTDSIHLTPLEIGMALLVILLAAMLIRSKRQEAKPADRLGEALAIDQSGQRMGFEELKEWVKESESICETLSKNLQEKRRIAKRLIAQLDAKIHQMNQLADKLSEKDIPPAEDATNKDFYPVINEMADSGCQVSQIARWLRISEGEVQLVLDLKKFGHREDPGSLSGTPPM